MFEKILSTQLKNFISEENLLFIHQSGFRKNHSTSTCIIDLLSDFYLSLDDNKYVLAVFLDFSSAFDTISIDLLIHKLRFLFNFSDITL